MRKLFLVTCLIILASCNGDETPADNKTERQADTDTLKYDPAAGLDDGINETKYPNGNLHTKGSVVNGKRHGTWESWYENGNKWSETTYSYGVREGKTVSYYPNGMVRYIGYYNNNKQSGKWMTFDESGNLVEEKDYSK